MSYLHIGQNAMIPEKRIIGIFDLDITSQSKRTREFLEKAEREGVVVPVTEDIPKSFWCATIRTTGRSCIFPS